MPDIETVAVGGTPDDRALFRAGRAFVTGPVDAAELDVSVPSLSARSAFSAV